MNLEKRERIAGIVAITIALIAVIAPLAAPPPDFGILKTLGALKSGKYGEQALNAPVTYNESFTGARRISVSVSNGIVVLKEGGQEINIVIRGTGHATEENGTITVTAGNAAIIVTAPPGSISSLKLKAVNSIVRGITGSPLEMDATNAVFNITLAVTGPVKLNLMNSYGYLEVRHPEGKGVKVSARVTNGAVKITGDYERSISFGTAEVGEGPYLVSISAMNSYVKVRVTGQ